MMLRRMNIHYKYGAFRFIQCKSAEGRLYSYVIAIIEAQPTNQIESEQKYECIAIEVAGAVNYRETSIFELDPGVPL